MEQRWFCVEMIRYGRRLFIGRCFCSADELRMAVTANLPNRRVEILTNGSATIF